MGLIGVAVCAVLITGLVSTSILTPRYYVYHEKAQPWDEARRTCETFGGTLAILHDISTMPDINASLPQLQNQETWIGLFFEDHVWKWTDNSVYDWSNWEPYSELKKGNCVSVTLANDYHWEKKVCDETKSFFCELQQGRCNFRMYPNASLSGNSIFKRAETIGYCMSVCEEATEITCLSFEYSQYLGTCQLSDVNRWIKEDSFRVYDPTWSYYHRTCVQATIWPANTTTPKDENNSTSVDPSLQDNSTTTDVDDGVSGVLEPHHYVIYNTSLSWYAAQDFCKDTGGYLATIYDQATLPETGYIGQHVTKTMWIGLSRTPDRYWRWVGNTSLTWKNWKYQPKPTDRSEKCTMVILDDNAYWYPTVCQTELWFICQFPAEKCIYSKTSEAALLANNNRIYNGISLSDCQSLCDNTTDFQCRSYEYFRYSGGICQLSEGNKWTLASYYKTDLFGWDYYHKQCNFGGPLPEVPTTTTTTSTTTTTVPTTTTEQLTTTTEPPTTTKPPTTTQKPSTTTKKTFTEIKNELVAMGDEIRQKRLKERRTSAVDNRPSATGAGVVATIILGSLIALVVVLDIGTIKATCEQHRRRKRPRRPVRVAEDNYAFEMDNHRKDSLLDDDETSEIVRVEREDDNDSGGISITGNHIEVQINNPDDDDSANETGTRSMDSDEYAVRSSPVRIYHGERFGHIGTQTTLQELDQARQLWVKYRGRPNFNDLQRARQQNSKNIETQTICCSFDAESSVDGDYDQTSINGQFPEETWF